ncbi:alanine racemase [Paracoccus pacificus]|uniref:Alanine racemase n=1 Tax=Paracoccus pacificus TaxID=1463598 RepID=A0ABW4R420_9RHOB
MGMTVDLGAIVANWRALAALAPAARPGAVVKANAYGLGAERVGPALATAGARDFFVAIAAEGAALRRALGPGPRIFVLSGHMNGMAGVLDQADLVPVLNSPEQFHRDLLLRAGKPFAIQLDSGMNRLGIEPGEWAAIRAEAVARPVRDAGQASGQGRGPALVMSHLACADEPAHPMNPRQLAAFVDMTRDLGVPRSLAATGGILLGPEYHFDLTRPGVGLYGGLPFADARPVVRLALPVIQTRRVAPGETVGYGNAWTAGRESRVATVAAGYADGLLRSLSGSGARLWAGDRACPIIGRVSMDLITVDVTDLADIPEALDILGPHQGVDALADAAGTIGYEILTSLGDRYPRTYLPVPAEPGAARPHAAPAA